MNKLRFITTETPGNTKALTMSVEEMRKRYAKGESKRTKFKFLFVNDVWKQIINKDFKIILLKLFFEEKSIKIKWIYKGNDWDINIWGEYNGFDEKTDIHIERKLDPTEIHIRFSNKLDEILTYRFPEFKYIIVKKLKTKLKAEKVIYYSLYNK